MIGRPPAYTIEQLKQLFAPKAEFTLTEVARRLGLRSRGALQRQLRRRGVTGRLVLRGGNATRCYYGREIWELSKRPSRLELEM